MTVEELEAQLAYNDPSVGAYTQALLNETMLLEIEQNGEPEGESGLDEYVERIVANLQADIELYARFKTENARRMAEAAVGIVRAE